MQLSLRLTLEIVTGLKDRLVENLPEPDKNKLISNKERPDPMGT